ncbi:hypothetical protein Zmor_010495 [Zophobas morio]|uniref:Uncharacterized protein n=1 Tax=Zophobas morio TaxID=2755281 RepID=A0AA38IPJ5_9CUCU|nr:hypothetical protein Zmor_010495 [Zophobas morio]
MDESDGGLASKLGLNLDRGQNIYRTKAKHKQESADLRLLSPEAEFTLWGFANPDGGRDGMTIFWFGMVFRTAAEKTKIGVFIFAGKPN